MTSSWGRRPGEAWELVARAVTLQRGRAPRTAVLAALDQARASIRHEPDTAVARRLWAVCRGVTIIVRDEERIDEVLRLAARDAARDLHDGPASGDEAGGPRAPS
jgi:hypothetical protein